MKTGASITDILASFLGRSLVQGPFLTACNKTIDMRTNKKLFGSYSSNRMLENSIRKHYFK